MNECHFLGNLTRDPELRETSTNAKVVNFGIAVNRSFKRKNGERTKEASFLECEAWDTGAEVIDEHFKKGDPIIIHASARTESWETNEGRRSRIKFRVNKFEFVPNGRKQQVSNEDESVEEPVAAAVEGDPPF